MTSAPRPISFRPDFSRQPPGQAIVRSAAAHLIGHVRGRTPEAVSRGLWADDDAALALITRAASSPATTTTSGWSSQLASTAVADFIGSLSPISAGAALLRRGLQLSFDGAGSILVPSMSAGTGSAAFVGEGAPIPVESLALSGPLLSPRKMASIAAFTRETLQHSTPNVEQLVKTVLSESVGLSLDAALLDNAAGSATRPAGLLNGVSAIAASAATPPAEAMAADLAALASAVAPVAGAAPIIYIMSPGQAVAARLRMGNAPSAEILSSSALEAGTVVAIASNALASAIDPVPRFETDEGASTVHMEDTSPAAIAVLTGGSPATAVSAPVRSMFQVNAIAVKLVIEVAWVLRDSDGIAFVEDVVW